MGIKIPKKRKAAVIEAKPSIEISELKGDKPALNSSKIETESDKPIEMSKQVKKQTSLNP